MEDMRECIRLAKAAGIADDKIILDPGVGFGKTYEMNLEIIDKLEIMQKLNYVDYASATAIALAMLVIAFVTLFSINMIQVHQARRVQ